jgi:hypothetical protein
MFDRIPGIRVTVPLIYSAADYLLSSNCQVGSPVDRVGIAWKSYDCGPLIDFLMSWHEM